MTKNNHPILYIIFLVTMLVFSTFFLRLMISAEFTPSTSNDFEFISTDNQITNLDDIVSDSKGLFEFFRNIPNRFQDTVNALNSFNVLEQWAEDTKDIWLLGSFINFMAKVWTLLVYVASTIISAIWTLIDIIKFIFTLPPPNIDITNVSISGVG